MVDLPTPEDLVKAVPYEWSAARQRKLPKQGEQATGHSWVIVDKSLLKESPYTYWNKTNKLANNVPIVFGKLLNFYYVLKIYLFARYTHSEIEGSEIEGSVLKK